MFKAAAKSVPIECPIFPDDHIWNTAVATLPVDPNSAAMIELIASDHLHPDFGSGEHFEFPENFEIPEHLEEFLPDFAPGSAPHDLQEQDA